MAGEPPVLADDWSAMLLALPQVEWTRALRTAEPRVARAVLAAPAAIARWMVERSPRFVSLPRLRLAVLGAEKLDAVDAGRWYQALPTLLAANQVLEVTLVGRELDAVFASPLAFAAPPVAARTYTGALRDFVASHAPDFDLAVLFHPGFPKHREWLGDASIATLIGSGVTVVAASYEEDEYEMDRWVAESHGFAVHGKPCLNPWYVELGTEVQSIRWGRVLWQFGSTPPLPGWPVDAGRLARLDELGRMVMHSIALGKSPLGPYGAEVEARTREGAPLALVYLFDEYFVDPASGDVLAYAEGSLRVTMAALAEEELATRPRAQASALERAIWAADVKSRRLMQLYGERVPETTHATLADSMHTDLTAKVEALFRP
jgi:hypothetical protein